MPLSRIAVDTREAASGIPDILRRKGMYVQMKTLDVGDYIVSDCAIERKTVRDFLTSLYRGRLFEQAQRIATTYPTHLLIVEGNSQQMLADLRNPKVYWGALLALAMSFDFRLLFTLDREQTAELIHVFGTMFRARAHGRPILIKKPRMATTKERQLSVVEGLPMIGPKLAEKLLASFGSVRNVFRASRSELALKGGLGYARAGRVQELLDAQYPTSASRQTQLS